MKPFVVGMLLVALAPGAMGQAPRCTLWELPPRFTPQVEREFAQIPHFVFPAAMPSTDASWQGEGLRDRGIPLAVSYCYELGKRWQGRRGSGMQWFVGLMAEPTLRLANPYRPY